MESSQARMATARRSVVAENLAEMPDTVCGPRAAAMLKVRWPRAAAGCRFVVCGLVTLLAVSGCGSETASNGVDASSDETVTMQSERSDDAAAASPTASRRDSNDSAHHTEDASPGASIDASSGDAAAQSAAVSARVTQALRDLAAAHRNRDPDGWQEAYDRLQSEDAAAVPALLDALSAQETVVREQASALLTQHVDRITDSDRLRNALQDESPLVRVNIASALSVTREHAQQTLAVLRDSLENDNASIRQQAAIAIGNFGAAARSARSALQARAAEDPEEAVRSAAQDALEAIAADPASEASDPVQAPAAQNGGQPEPLRVPEDAEDRAKKKDGEEQEQGQD